VETPVEAKFDNGILEVRCLCRASSPGSRRRSRSA